MEDSLHTDSFARGVRDAVPLLLAIAPYAVILGDQASRTGLSTPELGLIPCAAKPASQPARQKRNGKRTGLRDGVGNFPLLRIIKSGDCYRHAGYCWLRHAVVHAADAGHFDRVTGHSAGHYCLNHFPYHGRYWSYYGKPVHACTSRYFSEVFLKARIRLSGYECPLFAHSSHSKSK